MRASILVCPLSRLSATLADSGAGSVVTLIRQDLAAALPSLGPVRHLSIDMSDIVAPRDGFVVPAEAHVEALLGFVRTWDRRAPLLIHCYAGVSRSTAAAYAACCALCPDRDESEVARLLRAASPTATPNPRLVALADAALGRDGRMTRAIREIGRGVDCFEGTVFRLDLSF